MRADSFHFHPLLLSFSSFTIYFSNLFCFYSIWFVSFSFLLLILHFLLCVSLFSHLSPCVDLGATSKIASSFSFSPTNSPRQSSCFSHFLASLIVPCRLTSIFFLNVSLLISFSSIRIFVCCFFSIPFFSHALRLMFFLLFVLLFCFLLFLSLFFHSVFDTYFSFLALCHFLFILFGSCNVFLPALVWNHVFQRVTFSKALRYFEPPRKGTPKIPTKIGKDLLVIQI